jgi:hypothetical protein
MTGTMFLSYTPNRGTNTSSAVKMFNTMKGLQQIATNKRSIFGIHILKNKVVFSEFVSVSENKFPTNKASRKEWQEYKKIENIRIETYINIEDELVWNISLEEMEYEFNEKKPITKITPPKKNEVASKEKDKKTSTLNKTAKNKQIILKELNLLPMPTILIMPDGIIMPSDYIGIEEVKKGEEKGEIKDIIAWKRGYLELLDIKKLSDIKEFDAYL